MTCSLCGGVCRCTPNASAVAGSRYQPRFESSRKTLAAITHAKAGFTDLEGTDSSEQGLAASLVGDAGSSRPKFIVERNELEAGNKGLRRDDGESRDGIGDLTRETRSPGAETPKFEEARDLPQSQTGEPSFLQEPGSMQIQPNLLPEDASSWRREVSERLHRYHARRRPRAPRYPSLRLKFEETNWSASTREAPVSSQLAQSSPVASVTRQTVAREYVDVVPEAPVCETGVSEAAPRVPEPRWNEATAKIIEFPRYAPPVWLHALAEPMLDRPRILEAPEVVPPPPALGGMTIEETERAEPERRPGIDMPLQSAPSGRRMLAVAIDGAIVLAAAGVFGSIFYRLTRATPTVPQMAALGAGLPSVFWAGYQYLLMVYSGTTPGLRAMKLRVQRFDGTPASRRLRRWRVLGSILSAVSLGMGYAWHFLDEDGLCWHERVTKTYIAEES
jgi:uncharacterized RDD family membrane protein YckC